MKGAALIMKFITHSEDETAKLGIALSKKLKKGSVFSLDGEMGAGKTAFVRGVMSGLGYKDEVTSPTFALCHCYETDPVVYHYDLYRLTDADDIFSAGLFDCCDGNSVVFIEWAKELDELGNDVKTISFSYGENENERIIETEDGLLDGNDTCF